MSNKSLEIDIWQPKKEKKKVFLIDTISTPEPIAAMVVTYTIWDKSGQVSTISVSSLVYIVFPSLLSSILLPLYKSLSQSVIPLKSWEKEGQKSSLPQIDIALCWGFEFISYSIVLGSNYVCCWTDLLKIRCSSSILKRQTCSGTFDVRKIMFESGQWIIQQISMSVHSKPF